MQMEKELQEIRCFDIIAQRRKDEVVYFKTSTYIYIVSLQYDYGYRKDVHYIYFVTENLNLLKRKTRFITNLSLFERWKNETTIQWEKIESPIWQNE